MDYLRFVSVGIILGSLSQVGWTTSPMRFTCNNSKYSPCVCSSPIMSGTDYDSVTCRNIPIGDITALLQRLRAKSDNKIYLGIVSSEITDLPSNFLGETELAGLSLTCPNLKTVDEDAFLAQANSLNSIGFYNWDLPSVPVKALSKLNKLEYLTIENTKGKFDSLTEDTFDGLKNAGNFRQLFLKNNGIKTIGKGTFAPFTDIVYLYLNKNELSDLKANALPPQKINMIELDYNNFNQVPVDLYKKMENDGMISLRFNQIVNVPSEAIAKSIRNKIDLNLYANAVNCDCGFKQLAEYFVENPYANEVHGECSSPRTLKGKHLRDIQLSDFSNC